jgi:hypothetical protein
MKTNDVLKVLGVAAVAIAGYYYYLSLDDYDEYFDEDNGEGRTCDYYTPYTCSQEGEVRFRNPNGEDVQIDEDCCNELGYTFGGNATTGKNACLCETPGEEIDWTVRPGLG